MTFPVSYPSKTFLFMPMMTIKVDNLDEIKIKILEVLHCLEEWCWRNWSSSWSHTFFQRWNWHDMRKPIENHYIAICYSKFEKELPFQHLLSCCIEFHVGIMKANCLQYRENDENGKYMLVFYISLFCDRIIANSKIFVRPVNIVSCIFARDAQ